ncbi:hypothetical protein ZYGR_0S02600 [Zygosaccharomyces rouxii]|uniref:ZYRO0F08316p n=2 Tax=Zygosaccharomyces rouxii TaxID=4956 RepID=C5DXW5_ZYGRC|nr:uncharacterized protein ZYRO0F08316g [Zygosaccharomyces rouxii]KAH9199384.1 centromere protein Chl4/mis15/CENP-N [Zygosaccharomyces rouxii]GAV50126.1 hypothetical protein ZYGR_0S02600 [Zygosaccharomyces rouxii]CAR28626.1 ZYRO0F08316p [Zygosaccharomyces rouxii]
MELSDDFIPKQDRKVLLKKLGRLPLTVLCHLVEHWSHKYDPANGMSPDKLAHIMSGYLKRRANRKTVVARILLEFWPQGLSLYQLAQIDSYTLVQRPNLLFWKSTTAIDPNGIKKVLNLDPNSFVHNLKEDIHRLYLSHIYIFKHPELPSIICRIQLFEPHNLVENGNEPNLISRSPYYVVFPMNSPNVIHSSDDDSYAQLILQSVQRTIAEKDPIVLRQNDDPPVKSLETMHVLKGVSRYSNSLGPWSKYADADFDISPFDNYGNHISVKGKRVVTGVYDDDDPGSKRQRLENIMLRFKGSKKGVKAKKAYEVQRFNSRMHHLQKDFPKMDAADTVSKYASLIPVNKVNFVDKQDLSDDRGQVSIRFKFRGNDVFGGLHELCDEGNIDIDRVPGWLTGENGLDSGTILNGEFIKEEKRKGGLI